ncbi:sigma-70 family RNA polymerase sigma factor [Candidatus Poribacteria bacterium]|nr:sigma-70 family RNA polymerase sigma factor [Candidatus Poribacteria bacterium]
MRPLNPDEIVLVKNAQKGKDAFEELVRRYQHDVFRTIRIYTRNDSDAEDLAQETWMKVYQSIGTLKEAHRFAAWLEAIAVNTAKNWLKSRAYRNALETDDIEADADEMESQGILSSATLEYQRQRQIEQIRDAINSLSEKNRAVVYEFYICGYTADQISGRLGVPVSTVNSRLKEARKHLREEFATMVALSKIQETFAPENFVQQVMERVASLPLPVPSGGIIDKIKNLLPAKTVAAIGIATAVLGTGIGVTFTQLRHLQPAAQAQLAEAKIAFMSKRNGNDEIYVMDADGTNPVNLTQNPAPDGYPSWSPDGTRIAFASERDGPGEIYVMNVDGTNPVNLTNHPAWDGFPSWSPDGKKIAFHSTRDGNSEIHVMDADGKNSINLTRNQAGINNIPSWSPDGTKVAFISNRDGNWEIYVMDADGKNQTNLTKHPAYDTLPSWSPDGKQIAFSSNRDGNYEIYVIDADGKNPVNLTKHPADDTTLSWSPDGKQITFTSYRNGRGEIYMMDADGKNQINLTKHPADDSAPSWSPAPSPAPKVAVSVKDRWATLWGRLKRGR